MSRVLLRKAGTLASGAYEEPHFAQHPLLGSLGHEAQLASNASGPEPYYNTALAVDRSAIPCDYIVAEYADGEQRLPRLQAANDADEAAAIASRIARESRRSVVKVFSLARDGRSRLLLTLRI